MPDTTAQMSPSDPDAGPPAAAAADTLSGRLLIAMPGIGDPRFERAVILMVSHSQDEAMGIAVNRPMQGLSLATLLDKLGVRSSIDADREVLIGGPVERERGFVLHTDDYTTAEGTLPVGEGLSMTATREVLEAMGGAEGGGPRQSVLALGCAGWGSGQLEQELRDNVWLIAEPDEALVFDDAHETKWSRALAKLGVSAGRLSSIAGSA